jgi:hypothetical protein
MYNDTGLQLNDLRTAWEDVPDGAVVSSTLILTEGLMSEQ